MPKSDLRIDILGTSVSISADEEPEYLDLVLTKYRQAVERVQRKTNLKDPLKVAILTGFLLCDDNEKAGAAALPNPEPVEVEQLTLGMISRLDEIIKPFGPVGKNDTIPVIQPPVEDSVTENNITENIILENNIIENNITENNILEDNTAGKADSAQQDLTEPDFPSVITKLENTVKHYDWGSKEWLPAFLGQKNLSRIPWAELWLGVDPTESNYGKLPFLFKVLAAGKPLSVQVHPNPEQAAAGFERENKAGIPVEAPNRNYRDPNQKHEIICALGPFAALCGFREQWEISTLMEILSAIPSQEEALKTSLEKLVAAIKHENPFKTFLAELYDLESDVRKALALSIKSQLALLKNDFPEYKNAWELCVYLSTLYPEDPFFLAPLFLNIVELGPGEAVYVPAGVFHCYIKGMGLELMTSSDNVLRGGLTAKHIDREEVFEILDFCEYKPEIMPPAALESLWHNYPAPTKDFSLSVMHGTGDLSPYPALGPSMLIVTEGSAKIAEDNMELSKGEAVFIPAGKTPVFSGTFTAFAASAMPI